MSTSHFASMFRKKYAQMPDGDGKKKKNRGFFPTFTKKKSKGVPEVLMEEPANEDNLTVALSHLSSNPPSPARASDSMEDPRLWTSTFDEEEEDETNASSDMLLIFTSASNDDTDDTTPLQVLMDQPLSLTSFMDNGEDVIFRTSPPPPRKTIMPTSLIVPTTPIKERQSSSKPSSLVPLAPPKKEPKSSSAKPSSSLVVPRTPKTLPKQQQEPKKSKPIDADTYDQWHSYDDDSHWVEFVDQRQENSDWEWNFAGSSWGNHHDAEAAPMDEAAEIALLTSESFEYLPKDTSDEASLDPSTVVAVPVTTVAVSPMGRRKRSPKMAIVHETKSGEVEVCDPECPLRFFKEHEQEDDDDQEPPADTPGYPFLGDAEEEEEEEEKVEDLFSLSFYQHQIAKKFQSVESRHHMTTRLHRETLSIIGSLSEKLYTLEESLYACDEEARSRFQSRNNNNNNNKTSSSPEQPQEQDADEDAVSIATSASTETRKKRNTSYFSTEHFRYPSEMFGKCNVMEPFLRFGQAEI